MTILLIVEKNGNIKETKVKNLQVSELYKKAGFKSEEGFLEPVVSWPRPGIDPFTLDYQIQVFGKTKGRAGQENKYDFPPPIDTTLFFGNVAMIAVRPDGGVVDLTMSAWEMVYEQLFGGFEDLVDSHGRPLDDSEEEESEEEELEGVEYTKDGYVKDDFVVDDDDEEEEKPVFRKLLDSEEEDSEFEPPSKKSAKSVKKSDKKVDAKPEKKPVAKKSAKSVAKKAVTEVVEVVAPAAPEVVVDNFVKVEKKAKKSKKTKSEPVVLEISEPVAPIPEPISEEEPETKSKKPRKARAVKEPKEAKVKKVKELKEKSEPKKKTKRSGKKILDDIDSETVYVPMDTTELEEEKYV